jgi:hypothetical protein
MMSLVIAAEPDRGRRSGSVRYEDLAAATARIALADTNPERWTSTALRPRLHRTKSKSRIDMSVAAKNGEFGGLRSGPGVPGPGLVFACFSPWSGDNPGIGWQGLSIWKALFRPIWLKINRLPSSAAEDGRGRPPGWLWGYNEVSTDWRRHAPPSEQAHTSGCEVRAEPRLDADYVARACVGNSPLPLRTQGMSNIGLVHSANPRKSRQGYTTPH